VVNLTVKPMSEDKNKHKRHKKHKGGKNKGGGGISQ
jgi:hypothetical protein